jgi:hypothetical protein
MPLHRIVKTPTLDRTDLRTNTSRINNSLVVTISKATSSKISVAIMAQTVVATFNTLNKIVAFQALLQDPVLGQVLVHRVSHRHIEVVEDISIICSGLRIISVEGLKTRAIRAVMQDRTTLHLRQHLRFHSSSQKNKTRHKMTRTIILSDLPKN